MVWTVAWTDHGIGVAHSRDLIHWSEQTRVPVMDHEPNALNAWAPDLFYDDVKREYVIVWATSIPGRFPANGQRRAEDVTWTRRPPALLRHDEGLQDVFARRAALRRRLLRDRRHDHETRRHVLPRHEGRDVLSGADAEPPHRVEQACDRSVRSGVAKLHVEATRKAHRCCRRPSGRTCTTTSTRAAATARCARRTSSTSSHSPTHCTRRACATGRHFSRRAWVLKGLQALDSVPK